MKKIFSIFSVMAVVIAAMSFVSCSKDSNDPVIDEPKPESSKSVYYSFKVGEEFFKYCDIILTVTVDGESKTYTFSKDAKKEVAEGEFADKIERKNFPVLALYGDISYKKSLKVSPNFVLTDEGKKAVEATTDESVQFDFAIEDKFGGYVEVKPYFGTYVMKLADFLVVLNDGLYDHSAI